MAYQNLTKQNANPPGFNKKEYPHTYRPWLRKQQVPE
jgi:hypothetical protein